MLRLRRHAKPTSLRVKRVLRGVAPRYATTISPAEPFWQAKYYPFNLFTARKAREKLDYMHLNSGTRKPRIRPATKWSTLDFCNSSPS